MPERFEEGDIVRIKGNDHLGLHRVNTCEWIDWTTPGVPHYWLCECEQIRDPIDWSKIPAGATGIVTHSSWRGSASHLELVCLHEKVMVRDETIAAVILTLAFCIIVLASTLIMR